MYFEKDIYDKSIEYYLKAIKIKEDKLGINHVDTAESYNFIAFSY